MSAVNKVPEKQREDMCPKSHGGNSAYVPKPHELPKSTQEDGNNGDVNMEDGTAEEKKECTHSNRANNQSNNSE